MPEGAISVARPTKFGNPFAVGETYTKDDWQFGVIAEMNKDVCGLSSVTILGQQMAVDAFSLWIMDTPSVFLAAMDELPGHDLACWCKPGTPCHGDYLLGLVNS